MGSSDGNWMGTRISNGISLGILIAREQQLQIQKGEQLSSAQELS